MPGQSVLTTKTFRLPASRLARTRSCGRNIYCKAVKVPLDAESKKEKDPGILLKSVWYGAEAFGKLIALGRSTSGEEAGTCERELGSLARAA